MRVAPKEKKPFGIAIRPEATPDNTDSIVPTLLPSISPLYPY
jgi:hypothetical protein